MTTLQVRYRETAAGPIASLEVAGVDGPGGIIDIFHADTGKPVTAFKAFTFLCALRDKERKERSK